MWPSSSFKFKRAILLYHIIIAATLIENLLCASGTKSNLIFADLAGRVYYFHAILQTGKHLIAQSQFLRTVTAMLFKMSKMLAETQLLITSMGKSLIFMCCLYTFFFVIYSIVLMPSLFTGFIFLQFYKICFPSLKIRQNNNMVTNLSICCWFQIFIFSWKHYMIFRVIYPVLLIGQCLWGQDLRAACLGTSFGYHLWAR